MGAPCDHYEEKSMSAFSRQSRRCSTLCGLSAIAFILLGTSSSLAAISSPKDERKVVASADPFGLDHIESIARPRAFWWWLGNAVSKPEIDRQLQSLKSAGFGGLLICPLYEYKNPVLPAIPYLSNQGVEMFKYACARRRYSKDNGLTVAHHLRNQTGKWIPTQVSIIELGEQTTLPTGPWNCPAS